MPIEYVTRGVSFENIVVEAKAVRWICDDCGRREAFHDTPPYGEDVPTPQSRGWKIITPWNDGEEGARCPKCESDLRAREAALTQREAAR